MFWKASLISETSDRHEVQQLIFLKVHAKNWVIWNYISFFLVRHPQKYLNYVRTVGAIWIPGSFKNSFYWGWSCLRLMLMPLAILNSYTILTVALVQVLLCFGLGLAIWRFRRPTVLNASLLAETLEINMTWGPANWCTVFVKHQEFQLCSGRVFENLCVLDCYLLPHGSSFVVLQSLAVILL